jgi:hypothetical protein
MVSYASTRAFLDTYLESLRVLGNIVNVDVVNVSVEHNFSAGMVGDVFPLRDMGGGSGVKEKEREDESQSAVRGKGEKEGSPRAGSPPSDSDTVAPATLEAVIEIEKEEYMAEDLARTIWEGVEGGGVATIGWPVNKYMICAAARGEFYFIWGVLSPIYLC